MLRLMIHSRLLAIALALSALGLSACGYVLKGSGSILPPDVKSIYIPTVENNSTQLGLSDIVTDALRDEFDSYGTVSVVDRQNQADATLKVRIVSVKQSTDTVSNTNTASLMDSTMVLAGELRRVTGPVLWRDPLIRVTKTYATDASAVVTTSPDFASGSLSSQDLANLSTREVARGQQQSALTSMASDAARQIYDKAVAPDF